MTEKMMPGQKPYTPAEQVQRTRLIGSALEAEEAFDADTLEFHASRCMVPAVGDWWIVRGKGPLLMDWISPSPEISLRMIEAPGAHYQWIGRAELVRRLDRATLETYVKEAVTRMDLPEGMVKAARAWLTSRGE